MSRLLHKEVQTSSLDPTDRVHIVGLIREWITTHEAQLRRSQLELDLMQAQMLEGRMLVRRLHELEEELNGSTSTRTKDDSELGS